LKAISGWRAPIKVAPAGPTWRDRNPGRRLRVLEHFLLQASYSPAADILQVYPLRPGGCFFITSKPECSGSCPTRLSQPAGGAPTQSCMLLARWAQTVTTSVRPMPADAPPAGGWSRLISSAGLGDGGGKRLLRSPPARPNKSDHAAVVVAVGVAVRMCTWAQTGWRWQSLRLLLGGGLQNNWRYLR